jgi:hypothetical protein
LGIRNDRGEKTSLKRREIEFLAARVAGEQETDETVTKTAVAVIKNRADRSRLGHADG